VRHGVNIGISRNKHIFALLLVNCDSKAADLNASALQNHHVSQFNVKIKPHRRSARELLAENLVLLRNKKGWSQEALAFECGLHRTFVSHVERCARNISLDNIERLALALGVETGELLALVESPEK